MYRDKVQKLHIICEETFQISLAGYLILLLVETVKEGFVSNFFNLNILLGIILISGIGMAVLGGKSQELTRTKENHLYWGFAFSIITACIVYYKIQNLGTFAIIISIASFLIVLLFSYLIQIDEGTS